MGKIKKRIVIVVWVVLCVAVVTFLILFIPNIEGKTWVLSCAQQTEAPYLVVAHGKDYDVSNIKDPVFAHSKQVELICKAKNGKLLLTDKTNGKTYEGTYTVSSLKKGIYKVVIDGSEGTANISSDMNRTLSISIGGYLLSFAVD